MKSFSLFISIVLALSTFVLSTQAQVKTPAILLLPALAIDSTSVSVSGLSSGAFMAVQLGVAYSSQIRGIASVAGGIYDCAEGQTNTATDLCMKNPKNIDVQKYVKMVHDEFQKKSIDDPANLTQQQIFILNGTQDKIVLPESGQKLLEFYKSFGANVTSDFALGMGHGFPSPRAKNKCDATQFPWMNNCNYDGAGKILQTFYPPLLPAAAKTTAQVATFDQTEFNSKTSMMADTGNIFVPASCLIAGASCRLHIALHGCLQNPMVAQKAFTDDGGYNEWAEINRIVILYPAASMGKGNPNGCWDWFGFTGKDYAVKSSLQMTAIMKMVERLQQSLTVPAPPKE